MSCSTPFGTDGTSSRIDAGSLAMMAVIRLAPLRPWNAVLPLSIS